MYFRLFQWHYRRYRIIIGLCLPITLAWCRPTKILCLLEEIRSRKIGCSIVWVVCCHFRFVCHMPVAFVVHNSRRWCLRPVLRALAVGGHCCRPAYRASPCIHVRHEFFFSYCVFIDCFLLDLWSCLSFCQLAVALVDCCEICSKV